jgi:membrane protein
MAAKKNGAFSLLKATSKEWMDDDPFRQSAVIAYYSIFSLPALLIILIWVAGAAFGQEAVQGQISNQIGSMLGEDTGKTVETMIANAQEQKSNIIMKIIGIATLIFGATTVFFQLQKSLNYIWDVEQKPDSDFKKLLIDRASSLGLIIVIGFLLLISLVASALITSLSDWIKSNFPDYMIYLAEGINLLLSLGIATLLFAIMFKVLPDVEITWSMVWKGAFMTAILFVIGKFLLALYFGMASPGSTYGAAGSIILILLWVNYTCLILFFGAEFTQVYARHKGHRLVPAKVAQWRPDSRKGGAK